MCEINKESVLNDSSVKESNLYLKVTHLISSLLRSEKTEGKFFGGFFAFNITRFAVFRISLTIYYYYYFFGFLPSGLASASL